MRGFCITTEMKLIKNSESFWTAFHRGGPQHQDRPEKGGFDRVLNEAQHYAKIDRPPFGQGVTYVVQDKAGYL